MATDKFMLECAKAIADYANNNFKYVRDVTIDDVVVVWYSKTLKNHKALMIVKSPDGMYYECTYNGDKEELYLDAYKKQDNVRIKIKE